MWRADSAFREFFFRGMRGVARETGRGRPGAASDRPSAVGVVLLAALILIPLLAAGHIHSASDGKVSCAVCIVAHDSPLAVEGVVAIVAPAAASITAGPGRSRGHVRSEPSLRDSRAPPTSTFPISM
jgi:hypothetical protein